MEPSGALTLDLAGSTVADLRAALTAAERMGFADSAEVRVRTSFGANQHGARLRRVAVVGERLQDPSGRLR